MHADSEDFNQKNEGKGEVELFLKPPDDATTAFDQSNEYIKVCPVKLPVPRLE